MEICRACPHVQALHEGRVGHCRLNGCPCDQFAAPAPAPVATEAVAPAMPLVSVEAFTAILTAIGFVVGLLIGLWL